MSDAVNIIDPNTIVEMYTFRFGSSNKTVQLTQRQLDSIPYLATFISHKDDFLPIQNDNGEYVLNYPLEYSWFIPILQSITSKQPYTLLNELPENENVLEVLQLFDYLDIESFPLPLLKDEDLIQSNHVDIGNQKRRVQYHKANLSEARQTAAEFTIALSKNGYKLSDAYTVKRIFSLIKMILSNATIFSSRFRHHTLIIVKEYCYSFFSKKQQHLLPTTQQIAQYSKNDSFIYLYDDDKSLPDNFRNIFSWRGIYVSAEEHQVNPLSTSDKNTIDTKNVHASTGEYPFSLCSVINIAIRPFGIERHLMRHLITNLGVFTLLSSAYDRRNEELPIYEIKQNRKNNRTQSSRSNHLNTLPKRPNVDKFKHRYGPKAQKYR